MSVDTGIRPRQDFSSLIEDSHSSTKTAALVVARLRSARGTSFAALTLAACATLLLAACSASDESATDAAPTSTLGLAPTQAATAAAIASPAPPTPRSAADTSRDLTGFPFSTSDLRQALEIAGYSFSGVEERAPICPQTSVPELPFWSPNLAGNDSGPILVLWVYPTFEALEADWEAEPGAPPKPLLDGCELPTGFVYWNQNLVLVFETWSSLGVESPVDIDGRIPSEHPAVTAFLSMTP